MRLTFVQFLTYIAVLPCGISSLFVYLTIIFSKKYNLYDEVGGRKIHSGNIPRIGGVGFVTAYLISIIVLHFRFPQFGVLQSNFLYITIAYAVIFIMGLLDDIKNCKAVIKLLIQSGAAAVVLFAGFKFTRISFAPIGFFWQLGTLGYFITFFWIIGIINAVNLMDGIDGQAGTLSISILISYSVIFFTYGVSRFIIYVNLILVFAVIGFLFFNLSIPKAKIFMGDCGSQFLGFTLAILPLMQNPANEETVALPFAVLFLVIPILDTIAAIWRRLRDKISIAKGDRFHLHHKLMLIGFSPRGALCIFIIFQLIIDLFITMAVIQQGVMALVTLIGLLLIISLFFVMIHYEKERRMDHA